MFRRFLLALLFFPAIGMFATFVLLFSPTGSGVQAQEGTPSPTSVPSMEKDANVSEDGIQTAANLWLTNEGCLDESEGYGCLRIDDWVLNAYAEDGVGVVYNQTDYDPGMVNITLVPDEVWLESTGRGANCFVWLPCSPPYSNGCMACTTWGYPNIGPNGSGRIESIHVSPSFPVTSEEMLAAGQRSNTCNGLVTTINDSLCQLGDIWGEDIPGTLPGGYTAVCGDADVTMRMLEGDLDLDCDVDSADDQEIIPYYGSSLGSQPYSSWYDLEPSLPGGEVDGDVDIKDLQYVFGREGSTCQNPLPSQQEEPDISACIPEGEGLLVRQGDFLLDETSTIRISPEGQYLGVGQQFTLDILADNVANLGAYEFTLEYNPSLISFQGVVDGSFLGSTGRSVSCPGEIIEEGSVRFGCNTEGFEEPPSGSGQLAQIAFVTVGSGTSSLSFTKAELAHPLAEDIPANAEGGSVSILTPPNGFTIQPCGNNGCAQASDLYFTWDTVPGATFQVCTSPDVWMLQDVTCYDAPGTSWSIAPPTTSSKIVRYWAVRSVVRGQTSALGKHGAYVRFTENFQGSSIDAYWTVYKTDPVTKMVNGWSFQPVYMTLHNNSVPPNYMCASYPDRGCEPTSGGWVNGLWFPNNQSWDAPDYPSLYGPLVAPFASPYAYFMLNDWTWVSTWLQWGDASADSDLDGVLDTVDNCPAVYNPDQANNDRRRPNGSQIPGDFASNPTSGRLGDACDPDDDNDGLLDTSENVGMCPYVTNGDSDGDRIIDNTEIAWGYNACNAASKPVCSSSTDSDGDGITDCIETAGYGTYMYSTDSDGDSCPDWLEIMDLNGDRNVNVGDQLVLAQRVAGVRPPSDSDPLFDVNKDGYIDSGDQQLMARNTCSYKGYPCPCAPEP